MARRIFYNSPEWLKCKDAYAASVFYICERCKRPGYMVHHKVYITDENESDPSITLNWDNLEYLCLECHNREHFSKEITRNDVKFDINGQLIEVKSPPI